jgi:hypothetical protein
MGGKMALLQMLSTNKSETGEKQGSPSSKDQINAILQDSLKGHTYVQTNSNLGAISDLLRKLQDQRKKQ